MRQTPFVITRPDGFVGVEISVDDQLTPDEALTLSAEIATKALEAKEIVRKLAAILQLPRKLEETWWPTPKFARETKKRKRKKRKTK